MWRSAAESFGREIDEALTQWKDTKQKGQRCLTKLANTCSALSYLAPSSSPSSNIASLCQRKLYAQLLSVHYELQTILSSLRSVLDNLWRIVSDMNGHRKEVTSRHRSSCLTHDGPSFSALVKEVVTMHESQLRVDENVVRQSAPAVIGECLPSTLTLRASLWVMEPQISPEKIKDMDRAKRLEIGLPNDSTR